MLYRYRIDMVVEGEPDCVVVGLPYKEVDFSVGRFRLVRGKVKDGSWRWISNEVRVICQIALGFGIRHPKSAVEVVGLCHLRTSITRSLRLRPLEGVWCYG